MRNILNAILAALLFGAFATGAQANERHRFVVGTTNPKEVAQMIRQNQPNDPLGRKAISQTSCAKFIGCGTAEDLVNMLQASQHRATAPKTIAELPAYLDSLIVKTMTTDDQYWMACKTGNGDAASEPKWDCMTRTFHVGETCYADPKTQECVFARDCLNVVGKKQSEHDCIEFHPVMKNGDEIHVGWLGADAFPSGTCKLSVQKTGEQERTAYDMDECPRDKCDFSGPSRDLNNARVWDRPRISWRAKVSGDNVIRLPREVLTSRSVLVICIVKPDGTQSFAKVIVGGSTPYARNSVYIDGKTYVTYPSMPTKGWRGRDYHWAFTDGRSE